MKKLLKSEQSGRSMVEMLGVLAIIGVLSVGGIAGYSKAMAKYKLTKTIDQISMVTANIRTAFASSTSYAGLTTATARSWGLASPDMYSSTGEGDDIVNTLINPFLGPVHIYAAMGNGISDMGFMIQYNKLPLEACVSLATADWGAAGFSGITVGGSNSEITEKDKTPDLPLAAGATSIPFATAAALCENETDNSVAIFFY